MKRLVLFGITVLSLSLGMPVATQANDNIETVTTAQFEERLEYVTDTYTMYATIDGVNIREEPNTNCKIYDQTLRNTSFEVVMELDGWSMVTTCDGYAYIKSEYLSDKEIAYSENELYILAHLLAGEAQYCHDDEQRYVGSVVLNRVNHKDFPDSIEEVVFQRNQYSCIKDGNYYREPTDSNWENAKWLLEHGSILPDYVIFQSGDKQGNHVYQKTDYHYYCY